MRKKSTHKPKYSSKKRTYPKDKKIKGLIFWLFNEKSKRYLIDAAKLADFLELNNFYRFGKTIVKLENNIAKTYTPLELYRYILKYIKTQKKDSLRSQFIKDGETLLLRNKALLGGLHKLELKRYKDNRNKSIIFFNNVFLVIRKKGYKTYSYEKLKKTLSEHFIFESQIIQSDFDVKAVYKESQFYEFLKLSTNDKKHLLNVMCSIGYLLHGNKNPSQAKVIGFSDIDSQATNTAQGRSGKGLIIKALTEMLETIEYNGKNLDLSKDKFVFQSIIPYMTQLFVLQDVTRNFDFEALFAVITDKMAIEKKHQEKIILEHEYSPKIAVTTNYLIPDNGGSFTDRKHLLLLNNHFNCNNKPENHFGNLFFLEWDNQEYSRFYALMTKCLVKYLKFGLVKYNSPELQIQRLENETHKNFVEVMNSYYNTLNQYYNLKEIAARLTEDINSHDDSVKSRITSKWIESWANFKGYKIDKRMSGGVTKVCFKVKL